MTNTTELGFTDEVNVQILISLMKQHNIKYVVASPGTTNITLIGSLQKDPYFTLFSAADERSAAYIACGLAAETGCAVALSCTGATASRNYASGLTEAYYRKLPILAITSTQHIGRVGNMEPQVIDRSAHFNDICRSSILCSSVHSEEDKLACETNVNKALLELTREGGGPVHINLETRYSENFTVKSIPKFRAIKRIESNNDMPSLNGKKILIYVGAHQKWSDKLVKQVDTFCELYGAAVFCDHTSNYPGSYGIMGALVSTQSNKFYSCKIVDVLIHIGEISGAYCSPTAKETWRVSLDGQPRDAFKNLRYIFNMSEVEFFEEYTNNIAEKPKHNLFLEWKQEDEKLREKIPSLPFSNVWCAQQLAPKIPKNSVLHLGILNSLRSWNFFQKDSSVLSYCNTGGFGIDGCVSSLIGASLSCENKLYFGVVGDLALFYDINSLGNKHVGNNIRLLVVNNGVGTEFKNFNHKAAKFCDEADNYMAARGHYGNKSKTLLKHYADDLGYKYICASNKEEFLTQLNDFVAADLDQSVIFEVFTDSVNESEALKLMYSIDSNLSGMAKNIVKDTLGQKGINVAKKIIGKK